MAVYLDSCIVIYQTEEIEPWASRVRMALSNLATPDLVVSDLVRLECRVVPLRNNASELLQRFEMALSELAFAPLTSEVYNRAAELRARCRIKTPAALHLAAAVEHGCDEFWTNDDRFASVPAEIAFRTFK
ncbi:MAG: type II toxin-antitoxin system VapC family toxin [Tepidiformaceae bacterium]